MSMINHDEAMSLEGLVRKVFNCNRYGVMEIADADYLENNPLDAAIVLFAPLYRDKKTIEEIDHFMDDYICLFKFPDEYEYDANKISEYIEGLKRLVFKYYDIKL